MMRYTLIALVGVFMCMGTTVDTEAATITLKSGADIVSSTVRLGDIADLSRTKPSEQLESFAATAVCSAPPPAEAFTLTREGLASALKASGVDVSALAFAGSDSVVVRRVYELVTLDELQKEFSGHVSVRTGWAQNSFLVAPPKNFTPTPVPAGQRTVRVETVSNEDFHGSVMARFQVVVDGKHYCELVHRFDIKRYVEALVASHKIERGQAVSASDVEVRKIEQSLLGEKSFTRVEQAVGLLAIRTIRSGAILDNAYLTRTPVIQKGKDASVRWEGDGFSITTMGRVLEDGCVNELVRVRLASRKIVRAAVVDSNTLRITQEGE